MIAKEDRVGCDDCDQFLDELDAYEIRESITVVSPTGRTTSFRRSYYLHPSCKANRDFFTGEGNEPTGVWMVNPKKPRGEDGKRKRGTAGKWNVRQHKKSGREVRPRTMGQTRKGK